MDNKLKKYVNNEDIEIIEDDIPIDKIKGLYCDGTIILDKNIETTVEKQCILAEELGHYYTSHGNIINQKNTNNIKQERRAKGWAYKKLVKLIDLINAYKNGIRNRYELAQYLDVTEKFLEESIRFYKEKYGLYYKIDNYIIYFEPLSVLEIM